MGGTDMKRILTAALAALLLCLSLAGCSSAKGKTLLTLEKDGRTLEQLYFDVTEGENGEKTEEGTQEAVAE